MRRLTTIRAGWWWLAVAYVSPCALLIVYLAFLLWAGCHYYPTARHVELCVDADPGKLIRSVVMTVFLVLLCGGVVLAAVCALRNLLSRSSRQAWALSVTVGLTLIAAAWMMLWVWIRAGSGSLPFLWAAPAGLVTGLIVGPIAAIVSGAVARRRHRQQ